MIPVTLTNIEMVIAIAAGAYQTFKAIVKGYRNQHEYDGPPWDISIEGTGAEIAYCKATGVTWSGSIFKGPDVGENIQVRQTRYADGRLPFRVNCPEEKKDNPKHRYVLVTGEMPNYKVIGWKLGLDCMRDEWFTSPDPKRPKNYFVPQSELIPINPHT